MKLYFTEALCNSLKEFYVFSKNAAGETIVKLPLKNDEELDLVFEEDIDKNLIGYTGGIIKGVEIIKEKERTYRILSCNNDKKNGGRLYICISWRFKSCTRRCIY